MKIVVGIIVAILFIAVILLNTASRDREESFCNKNKYDKRTIHHGKAVVFFAIIAGAILSAASFFIAGLFIEDAITLYVISVLIQAVGTLNAYNIIVTLYARDDV